MESFHQVYTRCCTASGVQAHPAVIQAVEEKDDREHGFDLCLRGSQLTLYKHRIGNKELELLAQAIKESGLLVQKLDLSLNNITDAGADSIVDILISAQVTHLNLGSNSIGPDGLDTILAVLQGSRGSLSELVLHNNPLGSVGGIALSRVLKRSECPLTFLDIASTEQDTDSIVAIANSLRHNTRVEKIILDNPYLFSWDDEVVMHIADVLTSPTCNIREISLAKHRIRCSGAGILAAALAENSSVRSLDLRCNEISVQGAKHLARLVLRPESKLAHVDLQGNRIQDEGAMAIGASLEFNSSLKSLNLVSNLIGDRGLTAVGRGLQANSSLSRVFLLGNNFGERSSKLFYDLCNGRFLHCNMDLDFYPHVPPDSGTGDKEGEIHIAVAR